MKVLGIERNVVIDFKDTSGRQIHTEGIRLHLGEEKPDVEGIAVNKPIYIANTKDCYNAALGLMVGNEIRLSYNRFGQVDYIVLVD